MVKVLHDHYSLLGLPTGEEGTKLDKIVIRKAYRQKALQLHPDKRPNDPHAKAKFQRLQNSYETLMDPQARQVFDSILLGVPGKQASRPKTQVSRPSAPNGIVQNYEYIDDSSLFWLGALLPILLTLVFPAARLFMGFSWPWIIYTFGYDYLSKRRKLEIRWMIIQVISFLKRNPPQAATNHESLGDNHESLGDWVLV